VTRYTPVVECLVFLALLFASYKFGVHNAEMACEAAKIKPLQQSIAVHNAKAARGLQVEKQTVVDVAQTDAVFDQIDMEVKKYEQSHPAAAGCGLDADGLRLWRAANAGTEPDDAGQSDASVSQGTAPAGQRQGAGPAGQPHAGGTDLPQVPQDVPRPGQVAGGDR
jgi:hypothetical protein